jgi:hypothetical protein
VARQGAAGHQPSPHPRLAVELLYVGLVAPRLLGARLQQRSPCRRVQVRLGLVRAHPRRVHLRRVVHLPRIRLRLRRASGEQDGVRLSHRRRFALHVVPPAELPPSAPPLPPRARLPRPLPPGLVRLPLGVAPAGNAAVKAVRLKRSTAAQHIPFPRRQRPVRRPIRPSQDAGPAEERRQQQGEPPHALRRRGAWPLPVALPQRRRAPGWLSPTSRRRLPTVEQPQRSPHAPRSASGLHPLAGGPLSLAPPVCSQASGSHAHPLTLVARAPLPTVLPPPALSLAARPTSMPALGVPLTTLRACSTSRASRASRPRPILRIPPPAPPAATPAPPSAATPLAPPAAPSAATPPAAPAAGAAPRGITAACAAGCGCLHARPPRRQLRPTHRMAVLDVQEEVLRPPYRGAAAPLRVAQRAQELTAPTAGRALRQPSRAEVVLDRGASVRRALPHAPVHLCARRFPRPGAPLPLLRAPSLRRSTRNRRTCTPCGRCHGSRRGRPSGRCSRAGSRRSGHSRAGSNRGRPRGRPGRADSSSGSSRDRTHRPSAPSPSRGQGSCALLSHVIGGQGSRANAAPPARRRRRLRSRRRRWRSGRRGRRWLRRHSRRPRRRRCRCRWCRRRPRHNRARRPLAATRSLASPGSSLPSTDPAVGARRMLTRCRPSVRVCQGPAAVACRRKPRPGPSTAIPGLRTQAPSLPRSPAASAPPQGTSRLRASCPCPPPAGRATAVVSSLQPLPAGRSRHLTRNRRAAAPWRQRRGLPGQGSATPPRPSRLRRGVAPRGNNHRLAPPPRHHLTRNRLCAAARGR